MAEKKYYWLKLKKDFFKRHDIKIIEAMPNGKDYILFYLKMLLESIDHDGGLRFNDTIPYNENMLSIITNTNVDIVRNAMKVFTELQLIEICDDSTIFMAEVNKMFGSETTGAVRVRKFRENKQLALQCNGDVTKSNEHIEIEIEKEKEIEKEIKEVFDVWNSFAKKNELPTIVKLTPTRISHIKNRSKESEFDLDLIFEKILQSKFLRGENDRSWKVDFDFVFASKDNYIKILEDKYKSTPSKPEQKTTIVLNQG